VRVILIEGVPGSGKTTLAKFLCEKALARGLTANWYPEGSANHPVHPHTDRTGKNLTEYYLQQWRQFICANTEKSEILILEGSLFQSTIRFMIEADNETVIAQYFKQCQLILCTVPTNLIYLRPPDIRSHIDWTSSIRGSDWTDKVKNYLENTAFCKNRGWSGTLGMTEFWCYYADYCDALVNSTRIPNRTITSGNGYFESRLLAALNYTGLATLRKRSNDA